MISYGLLLLIPASLVLAYFAPEQHIWIFITAVLAIAPLAEWVRRGTEQIAHHSGPAIGGLLNVTLGNLTELILALLVLRAGQTDVVKAQITGSIIGNSLLGLGIAMLVGTWSREKQKFNRQRAGLLSSLLMLSVIALLLPAIFDYTERRTRSQPATQSLDEHLSLAVSCVMISVYVGNLVYTLVTHRSVFEVKQESNKQADWSLWKALLILLAATVTIGVEGELISRSLEETATGLGLTPFFLGVIVLAVIGNAAEYVAAVYFAHKNQLGLAMSITVGSTIQVALLVAPCLVLVSYLMGTPMDLVFANPLELIAIAAVAFIISAISHDGEGTWFEAVLLLAVYLILAIAFFFVTP
jgi:Ca2+:H+ antiporter